MNTNMLHRLRDDPGLQAVVKAVVGARKEYSRHGTNTGFYQLIYYWDALTENAQSLQSILLLRTALKHDLRADIIRDILDHIGTTSCIADEKIMVAVCEKFDTSDYMHSVRESAKRARKRLSHSFGAAEANR